MSGAGEETSPLGFFAGVFVGFAVVSVVSVITATDQADRMRAKFLTYCETHSSYAECRTYWDEGRWPK